jgi:hypothetical protein
MRARTGLGPLAFLAVLQSACGEEGPNGVGATDGGVLDAAADAGGTSDAGATPPAPEIIGTVPTDGATRVDPADPLVVTFSAPIAPDSGDRATLSPGGDGAPVALNATVEGSDLRLVPASPLAPRTDYVLQVAEVEGTRGGVQPEPLRLRFTTGGTEPVSPVLGSIDTSPLDCRDRYVLPAEIAGPEGLGQFGWEWSVLHVPVAWPFSNRGVMPWISDNSRSVPSVRVNAERAPETSRCLVEELRTGTSVGLAEVIRAQSAFHDPTVGLDTLSFATYAAPAYPDAELSFPLTSALWGLFTGITPVEGAPAVQWTAQSRAQIESVEAAYPEALVAALADFAHAVGEAHILRASAAGAPGSARWAQMARSIVPRAYDRSDLIWLEPVSVLPDLSEPQGGGTQLIDVLELADLNRAAQRVASAAEAVRAAAEASGPFEGPTLDVVTPVGRFLVRPSETAHTDAPDDAALVLDLGGDDAYPGTVGSTHLSHLAASVLIDVAGNDTYGPQDWTLRTATRKLDAFDFRDGLTQGAGLFGVGMVIDGAGDDVYRSTVFGQGVGLFGVGVLYDVAGGDSYDATYFGQGAGQVGVGLLLDGAGNDAYTLGSSGMGMGRPRGQGILLDVAGDDDYLALHDDDAPELLEKYPLWFPSGYRDELDEEHNMSVAMGVGWGFRGDWFTDETNWAGGLGAAIDLGNGNDVRFADAMSMGQGFVYGMGLLYDDGGDDVYRAFWWSFGSGTHMGTGVMIENDGNDDLTIGQFSAALGHDTGISWYLDLGGDDLYAGRMTYGRALDHGLAFFVEESGDDIYEGLLQRNHGLCDINPDAPVDGLIRLGLFMDLGAGADAYLTPNPFAGNDAAWYQDPARGGIPSEKRGVGLDR